VEKFVWLELELQIALTSKSTRAARYSTVVRSTPLDSIERDE